MQYPQSRPLALANPPQIDLAAAARYFGAPRQADEATAALLRRTAPLVLQAAQPRAVWLRCAPAALPQLFVGQDIARHLAGCSECVLLAVTLGAAVDAAVYRAGVGDIAAGVAADALASALAEQVCAQAEQKLRQLFAGQGLWLTGRYSPGYGDWPIEVQPLLARVLDTSRRIGLAVTGSCLLTPRKSVTAALGLATHPATGHRAGCAHCALRDTCEYKARGFTCES